MEKLTKNFWENRYISNEIGWDLGNISTPLKDYIDQIKNKSLKILIPGCGNAYEADYLINKGFKNVYLIDYSNHALNNFKLRMPWFDSEKLICDDFFKHKGSYDLILEQTFFCAIDPILRKDYVKQIYNLLKTNGKLVGLLFNDSLNSDKPPFGGELEEYQKLFSLLFNIEIMSTAYNSVSPRMNRELFIKIVKREI